MKHTLTVTIDTPAKALEELRWLAATYNATRGWREKRDEAVDFDQLKKALTGRDDNDKAWIRLNRYAQAVADVLGVEDHQDIIALAFDEAA